MVVDADLTAAHPLPGSLLASLLVAAAPPSRAVETSPEGVTVALLYQGELADSSQVFIVRDADERALGIVQLSSESAPGMVLRGTARARMAATCMGPALDGAVLLPLVEGEIDGRSYAVMPYCRRFSSERWRWALERLRLRPVVLDWLHRLAATTLAPVDEADLERRFRRPIEQIGRLEGASERLVACSERALSRLASGAWSPSYVLMHGDLWKGNLLLRLPNGSESAPWWTPWSQRLAVIDWAGAQLRGYAFFDLVRAVESLGGGSRPLRAEIDRHCAVLGCECVDASAYVLAAAGALLDEIEEFPLHRLLAMAESALQRMEDAVVPSAVG